MAKLNIEEKQDHPIAVEQMNEYGSVYFLSANEVNAIVQAINDNLGGDIIKDSQTSGKDITWSIDRIKTAIAQNSSIKGKLMKSDNPSEDGTWIAGETGVYPNADNINAPEGALNLLIRSNASWTLVSVPIEFEDKAMQILDDFFVRDSRNIFKGDFVRQQLGEDGNFFGPTSENRLAARILNIPRNTNIRVKGVDKSIAQSWGRYAFVKNGNLLEFKTNGDLNSSKNFLLKTPDEEGVELRVYIASGASAVNYINTFQVTEGKGDFPYESYDKKYPSNSGEPRQIFVSPTGDDNENGETSASAFRTIEKALNVSKNSEDELVLMPGDYFVNTTIDIFKISKIRGRKKPRIILGDEINSGNSTEIQKEVYEYQHSGSLYENTNLFQFDLDDERTEISMNKRHPHHRGRKYRMSHTIIRPKPNRQSVLDANEPCYYIDTNNLITLRISAGSDIDANKIYVPMDRIRLNSTHLKLEWFNFEILFSGGLVFNNKRGEIRNVVSGGASRLHGFTVESNVELTNMDFIDCEAWGARLDGFSFHGGNQGVFSNMIFHYKNCWAHDCYDDGFSSHQYCQVYGINCLSEANDYGFTPAIGAHATYIDCTAQDCKSGGFTSAGGTNDKGITTDLHCYNCVAENITRSSAGGGVGFRGEDGSRFVNCVAIENKVNFTGSARKINCVADGQIVND